MKSCSFTKIFLIVVMLLGACGFAGAVPQQDVIGYWTIDLQPGFNLTAFPVLPDTPTMDAVIGDRLGAVEVTTWDHRLGEYRWARYDPDADHWSGNLFLFDRGRAYWINLLDVQGEMSIRVAGHPELYTRFNWKSLGSGWKYYGPTIGRAQDLAELRPESPRDILLRYDSDARLFGLAEANQNRLWISLGFSQIVPDEGYLIYQILRSPQLIGPITELEAEHTAIETRGEDGGPDRDNDPDDNLRYQPPPRPLVVGNSNSFPICLPNGDVCDTEFSVDIVRQTFRRGIDGELEPFDEYMARYVINGGGIQPGKFRIPITVSEEAAHVQAGDRVYIHVNGPGGSTTKSASFEIPEHERFIPDLIFPDFLRSGDAPAPVPVEFSLSAPYPNPFNDRFTLEFSLPETEMVEYRLYDLSGREVYNRELPLARGVHRLSLSAGSLPAGIYLFEIRAHGQRGLAKIAHLK